MRALLCSVLSAAGAALVSAVWAYDRGWLAGQAALRRGQKRAEQIAGEWSQRHLHVCTPYGEDVK